MDFSSERFQLDASEMELRVTSEFEYKGTSCSYTRYFKRFTPNRVSRVPQPIKFQSSACVRGWENQNYSSANVFGDITVTIESAIQIDSVISSQDVSSTQVLLTDDIAIYHSILIIMLFV